MIHLVDEKALERLGLFSDEIIHGVKVLKQRPGFWGKLFGRKPRIVGVAVQTQNGDLAWKISDRVEKELGQVFPLA